MASGTYSVVVWTRTAKGKRLFTLTARNADGTKARLPATQRQIETAGFAEVFREEGLTKSAATARKAKLQAEYAGKGYAYQGRKSLPQPMMLTN